MTAPTITLTDGVTTLELDPDLYWEDEFRWSATAQSMTRSLSGKAVFQVGVRNGGRPITLRNEDEHSGWVSRADMAQLEVCANTPDLVLTLYLRGVYHAVRFRHGTDESTAAVEGRPLIHFADPEDDDWVLATLRFITAPT